MYTIASHHLPLLSAITATINASAIPSTPAQSSIIIIDPSVAANPYKLLSKGGKSIYDDSVIDQYRGRTIIGALAAAFVALVALVITMAAVADTVQPCSRRSRYHRHLRCFGFVRRSFTRSRC